MINNAGNPPGGPMRPKTGSGFTNLQKFVQANQNNKLGSAITSGIQNSSNQLNQNLGQANQKFTQKLGENTFNTDENKAKLGGIINNAATSGQVNDADANYFTKMREAKYDGPTALDNVNSIQSQAGNVQNVAKDAATEQGRRGLLSRYAVGNNQYTQGQQRLDGMLLGKTINTQDLSQARQEALKNVGQAQRSINSASQQAQTVQNNNALFGKELSGQVDSQLGNLRSGLEGKVNQANSEAQQEYDALQRRYQSGKLNFEDVMNLGNILDGGLTEDTRLFDVDPTQLGSLYHKNQFNMSQVADPTQYAQYSALARLSGKNPNDLGYSLAQDQIGKRGDNVSLGEAGDLSQYNTRNDELKAGLQPLRQKFNEANSSSYNFTNNGVASKLDGLMSKIGTQTKTGTTYGGQDYYKEQKQILQDAAAQDPAIAGTKSYQDAIRNIDTQLTNPWVKAENGNFGQQIGTELNSRLAQEQSGIDNYYKEKGAGKKLTDSLDPAEFGKLQAWLEKTKILNPDNTTAGEQVGDGKGWTPTSGYFAGK